MKRVFVFLWAVLCLLPVLAQNPEALMLKAPGEKLLLHDGWLARRANEVLYDGNQLSSYKWNPEGWIKARVPGTVLTTLLENHLYPEPEKSLNNNLIPDIYTVGRDFYTYWFAKPFTLPEKPAGQQVWLNFRGINYMADIFLNGKRINTETCEGMFLRRSFNVTDVLRTDTLNVLAVIVYPPVYPGNPNGGQGGDGMIARNNTMQFTPGWDWIQPVRDRNTGIWDEVSITTTGPVQVKNPYIITKVPGLRQPGNKKQPDALLKTSVELENATTQSQAGTLVLETDGHVLKMPLTLSPMEKKEVAFKDIVLKNPRLWWPNGIGDHPLYNMNIRFEQNGRVSDELKETYGVREITSEKDAQNGGRKFFVNGQKIYMTGGNYICSDWLLRLSPERYKDEVRFHAEMNLRMIRIWGGALLERPDFYKACDEEGMLVMQDLWGSGDCNGAWIDPMKKESRERRWEYPDNHSVFLTSVEDQVKMVRNHPSLCFWCGANEWPLAKDIDAVLEHQLMPKLDPERMFVHCSTDEEFTHNLLGDNGDGPYGIREKDWFFTFRSHPFNPESGNVGSPEIESFREFMTEEELAEFPLPGKKRSDVWSYHKDLGYGDQPLRYGEINDFETYCKYIQAVNYDQYRSFMEGWSTHMWDWYTGILIWKTQNPWTALRGQMYDWYLDVNATLYGTRKGCEPLHPLYNIVTGKVQLLNSTVEDARKLTVKAELYNREGQCWWTKEEAIAAPANTVRELFDIPAATQVDGVYFLKLTLLQEGKKLTDNIYWLTTKKEDYSSLNALPKAKLDVTTKWTVSNGRYVGEVTLKADKISFLNRIKLFDKSTGKRILPVHYSDNYITLMPGDEVTVTVDFPAAAVSQGNIEVRVNGWN